MSIPSIVLVSKNIIPSETVKIHQKFSKDLFTDNADLSKISDDLYVSKAIQKTFIDLNEKGTKASASTGIILDTNSAVEEKHDLIFNKLFIYIIKEKNKDNMWFIGVVNSPTEYEENKSIC